MSTTLVDTAWGNSALWDHEYANARAIPSSHRVSPARALSACLPALNSVIARRSRALDAGSGAGRHAFWLAAHGLTVHAIDSSSVACEVMASRSHAMGLSGSISVEQAALDVDAGVDGTYDLVIDSYVSCHILLHDDRMTYLESLRRLLRPGGRLISIAMGSEDSYYQRFADSRSRIAVDPLNGIAKLLEPSDHDAASFSDIGPVIANSRIRFTDVVNGTPELRDVVAAVLAR